MTRSSRHSDAPRKPRAEDEHAGGAGQTRQQRASQTTVASDDVLDDIDRVLKEECGFEEDDIISDEEFEKAAGEVVGNYIQKPGQ